jgi:hypothetical protein
MKPEPRPPIYTEFRTPPVQADGGASPTGADLDQIADLLDNPQPAAAPSFDWVRL